MATSRVGRVQLRLGLPAELAGATAQLRRTAERDFVAGVLDELERLLHARFGAHAVIRIRRLSVACQVDASELIAHEVAAKLANDLAEQIVSDISVLSDAERVRPRSETIAIFADESHADAVYLADVIDGHADRWLHATRGGGATAWSEVATRGPAAVAEVVRWLRRMDRLEPVLALAGGDVLETVAAVVPDVAGVVELVRARTGPRRASASGQHRPHAAEGPPTTTATPPARAADTRDVIDVAAAAGRRVPVEPSDVDAPPAGERPRATDATGGHDGSTDAGLLAAPAAMVTAAAGVALDTTAAGLFFLAGRVLEIELAERLWAAGVPEGAVLAAVGDAVLGTVDDPTSRWFGGGFEGPRGLPAIEAWAMTEVTETVQHVLGRRLVDFGVRMTPAELHDRLEHLAAAVPTAPCDGITRRLIAHSVAALAMIVGARLGERPSLARLREVCMRPGRLVLTDDRLHVVMPQEAIDIDIRRAGIDQDPGHVPWLQRQLRIEFTVKDVL